ncbi:MAG TPA: phosphotransferase [Candidatus Binatia bacterium]
MTPRVTRADEHLAAQPGVGAALAALGATVIAAEPVTALALPGSARFAFRVQLDDGRVVKLRRVLRPEAAARAWRSIEGESDLPFPRVLARAGEIVVETWIDGEPPATPPPPAVLTDAARVLARLHAAALAEPDAPRREPTAAMLRQMRARLDELRERWLLDRALAEHLVDLAGRFAPAESAIGITHNDLCGENLVVDRAGMLWVVDNEAMDVGFLDYDLARTWYRWGLDAPSWAAFVAAYAAAGGAAPHESTAPFWRIAAVARSAVVRAAAAPPERDVALARLRALAASP